MRSYSHSHLAHRLRDVDDIPEDDSEYAEWVHANLHLRFLEENESEDEFLLYAGGSRTYISSVLLPKQKLDISEDHDDLLSWNIYSQSHRSTYATRDGETTLKRNDAANGCDTLHGSQHLLFWRTFEGWKGKGSRYPELLQEFAHISGVHWREEYEAFIRFDETGEIDPVVSISSSGDGFEAMTLASVQRAALDDFVATGDYVLIRLFDFTLLRHSSFSTYGNAPEVIGGVAHLRYRQKVNEGHASYTRGYQVIRPRSGYDTIRLEMFDRWVNRPEQFVEFTIYDWRNKKVTKVSTDPSSTTNYFESNGNNLPFEVSPAFFKPDVLLKYQSDPEKYTIETRRISCRAAWELKSFDVNEAGQVHAYICDLRTLPYSEQLHWLSHNEAPKASISERAFSADFMGEFHDSIDALDALKMQLGQLAENNVQWWKPGRDDVLDQVFTPRTSAKSDWGEAFLRLATLVNEGLLMKEIRTRLQKNGVAFEKGDLTLKLLERLWSSEAGESKKLTALREIQTIRSKVKSHRPSEEGDRIARRALAEFGSYTKHFEATCQRVAGELKIIERLMRD